MASDASPIPTATQDASLLGLPAELRISIYTYTLYGNAPTVLHAPKIHSLLHVCCQTRAEAMAAYFAETQFIALCGADFEGRRKHRTGIPGREEPFKPSSADKMIAKPYMTKLIAQAGNSAIFEMMVFNVYTTRDVFHKKNQRERLCVARIEMNYKAGKAEIQNYDGPPFPSLGFRHGSTDLLHRIKVPPAFRIWDAEDVDAAVEEAMQKAREIADSDNFKGWTFKDLQAIAKVVGYRTS